MSMVGHDSTEKSIVSFISKITVCWHFTAAWDTFTLEVPVVIRLTCDCAVADDAVMPIRAESSS